jgi:DNA-binding CsgD family transcriptional regulator
MARTSSNKSVRRVWPGGYAEVRTSTPISVSDEPARLGQAHHHGDHRIGVGDGDQQRTSVHEVERAGRQPGCPRVHGHYIRPGHIPFGKVVRSHRGVRGLASSPVTHPLGQQIEDPAWPAAEIVPALTPRQRQLADQLASGRTNRQIARDLGLSEGTVRKHLESMYRRLGAQSRTQAAFIIVNSGISPSA